MKFLVTAAVMLCAGAALAQVPPTCDAQQPADKYQVLRRLSLDLRGHVPSYEEYIALDTLNEVPASTINAWLFTAGQNDGFKTVMRKYHEDLFWPNVSTVQLNNTNAQLTIKSFGGGDVEPAYSLSSAGRRARWRGVTDVNTSLGRSCGNFPTTFLADGGIRTQDSDGGTGITIKQEGYVEVHPYWDPVPTNTVKVCAFDAQETLVSRVAPNNGISCGDYRTNADPKCGCGPNLRFCYGPAAKVGNLIRTDMREQLNLLVDTVSTGGHPYTELLTTRTVQQSPAIDFWKKNLAANLSFSNVVSFSDETEPPIADRDFTATASNTWRPVDRGSDMHSGALTSVAYLLRFQTNRARANRYRIDFECQAFTPPSQLEDPVADSCNATGTDLTGRCTCRYCHQILEPAAAHWGQFSEAGTTLMSATRFPLINTTCVGSSSAYCGRYYVTNATDTRPGTLLPYQYANPDGGVDDIHTAIANSLAGGPRSLVNADINNGVIARCAVKRAFEYLMKREMRTEGLQSDERQLQLSLAAEFTSNNYSLPKLFEAIVSRPEYRSIR